jgi:hypothetical protein
MLEGLEVVDTYAEHCLDHRLAGSATPGHLAKARAPDRHLPTAVGWDDRSSIDRGGDVGDGE